MGAAIEKLDFILSGVLRVVYYRSLHMVSVPHGPKEVLAYAEENSRGEGRFGGHVRSVWNGIAIDVWRWDGVIVGKGLNMNVWLIGIPGGRQTAIVREHFWRGNFSASFLRALGG